MDKKFIDQFSNPSSEFRGKPFWAWNGKLSPEELSRQIRLMKAMGLGGFFMHSRVGLDTDYLSEEWFRNVDACISEAEKQGMEAWLYDEDRWPSGAAGGLVTKNKKYRMRRLFFKEYQETKKFKWSEETLAAFHVIKKDKSVQIITRLKHGTKPPKLNDDEMIFSFDNIIEAEREWYNGQTYLDTMNPEAVKEFIRITHESYKKRYKNHFNKSIPGIFTDEPHYGYMMQEYSTKTDNGFLLSWTNKVPQVFKKRYGYDLLDHLVELVYDVEGEKKYQARYHYHDCITFMFVDSFARQVGEWCYKNNIQFTGHVLEEDTPSRQTKVVGSAMRFYEHMQAPGMDLLTERWRVYDTAKQVTSVARQFGAKWRLTETYGCTGWDFSFAGHKALGDWQAALGINVRCQHLSWFTMQGEAKRDYPAGIFYQSPWWESYTKVENYFARIHAAMTKGEEVRDLLVIHPIESAWLLFRLGFDKNSDMKEQDEKLVALRDTLLCAHLDFDYGEEEIMSRHASIVKDKNGAKLKIKKVLYSTVVIPPMLTMRKSTVDLLERFRVAGGKVVFAGSIPAMVDAVPSDAVSVLASKAVITAASGADLVSALENTRLLNITDETGTEIASALYLLREDKENIYLFVCNTSNAKSQMDLDVMKEVRVCEREQKFNTVKIIGFKNCSGTPVELDADTGKMFTPEAAPLNDGWCITTSLSVLGSRIFIVPKKKGSLACPVLPRYQTVKTEPIIKNSWPIRLSECNNLVLDRPSYKIGSKSYSALEILKVDVEIRKALGVQPRGGSMIQPWAQKRLDKPKTVPVELTYTFEADSLPDGDLHLALECPEKFQIAFNGKEINTDMSNGWWVDLSLKRIPIDPILVKKGTNTIVMKINYEETFSGLEIVYLLGRFNTIINDTSVGISALTTSLKIGDWTNQGLSFYSGSVSYCTEVEKPSANERVFVHIPEYRGVAVRLHVNGSAVSTIAWEPNEADITDFLINGKNDLQIEVLGHRRNSHGPHHHMEKWPRWTGPAQYTSKELWFEGYNVVPCGLMKNPEIVLKKEIK